MTDFYRLHARLIPTESHIDVTKPRDVHELSNEELLKIAAGRLLPNAPDLTRRDEVAGIYNYIGLDTPSPRW